jgi:hypothetical protein
MKTPKSIKTLTYLGILLALSWAAPAWAGDKKPVETIRAQSEVPEASLLDIGIQVFDPGLPEDEEELRELEDKGVFAEIRKSEARYVPVRLMQTLQSTGLWGAVRIVPANHIVDIMVSGRIRKSTGKKLKLKIRVTDARGKVWLSKKYKGRANSFVYDASVGDQDPFQGLYNRIANDILKARMKRNDKYIGRVRNVARLRFAGELAPMAFGDYLRVKKNGRFYIERLPAEGDEMMARVQRIRERDDLFIDRLSAHYVDFFRQMDGPYDEFRAQCYREQILHDKLERNSHLKKIFGVALTIGLVGVAAAGGEFDSPLVELAMESGGAVFKDGVANSGDAKLHRQVLRQLSASLDSDLAPHLIDVEGKVTRLTGSVEAQYAMWRRLLRQIFVAEIGFVVDPT